MLIGYERATRGKCGCRSRQPEGAALKLSSTVDAARPAPMYQSVDYQSVDADRRVGSARAGARGASRPVVDAPLTCRIRSHIPALVVYAVRAGSAESFWADARCLRVGCRSSSVRERRADLVGKQNRHPELFN